MKLRINKTSHALDYGFFGLQIRDFVLRYSYCSVFDGQAGLQYIVNPASYYSTRLLLLDPKSGIVGQPLERWKDTFENDGVWIVWGRKLSYQKFKDEVRSHVKTEIPMPRLQS